MIERVIGAFNNLGFDLDDREIADILWLTVQMRRSHSSPLPQLQQQTPASTPEITPIPPQSATNQNKKSQKSSSKTETSANVYPKSSQDSNQTSSGLPIKIPTAKALRNQLAISRSLKPFKRRVPSKNEFILDETATAERIAEEKLLLPVMRPAPERWLELALVIDEEASMMLWKQTIKEFKQLLERHGAFRDVRTWGLFISEDSKVWLRSRTSSVSRQKKLHNPRELIDPNGRRLFVIISDCVSPAWRNGTITKALAAWASTSPMTIIQVLPEWLWERSALGVADSILLRSLAPGVPNQQLIMTALDLLDESDVVNKLKVPVVTLEPESLRNWAWMVAGAGDVQTKGFLLALDAEVFDIDDESTENNRVELSAKQRLQRFRLTASPMARKLAGLLAAAPVSLPVVRLIRQTILPQSSQVHVAEVFLGGILKPLSPICGSVDADKIQYDFMDGVRDLLLDAVPLTESTEVLRKVSEYLAQRAGLSVDEFTAMLVNPGLFDDSIGVLARPFAQVTAKVLRRLGGKYAELVEQIEQAFVSSNPISHKPRISTPRLNLERFYQACNPNQLLAMEDADARRYYIDFDALRGEKIIETLRRNITKISPDAPTTQLLTGHIGCGKSTELLRLKAGLELDGFHVVYFESSDRLEMADLDITDIFLAIIQEVSQSLEQIKIRLKSAYFTKLFGEIIDVLQTPINLDLQGELSVEIAKIKANTGGSPRLRRRLREYLEPRTLNILHSINHDLLACANKELQDRGKKGLVLIIDNLDRVPSTPLPSGRSLQEYLFIDRGEQLRKLNCHMVYTIPVRLTFYNHSAQLQHRLGGGVAPQVLSMIPVRSRTGEIYTPGLDSLRQMVLARAFPTINPAERLHFITELFETPEALNRLCLISGGHLRNLLRLLSGCIMEEQDLPLSKECVELVIQRHRDERAIVINSPEWDLIFQVVKQQQVQGDMRFHTLLESLHVFEYHDHQGTWFAVNPVLAETQKFKSWLQNKT